MNDTQIIEKLKTELRFVANNPNGRSPKTASQYAADLLAFIDGVVAKPNKPEEGKQYRLIGGSNQPSIANGNTWAESVIEEND